MTDVQEIACHTISLCDSGVFLLKGLLGNHICVFIMSSWFYHLHLLLLPNEYTSSGGILVEQSGSSEHWFPSFCENRYQIKFVSDILSDLLLFV